MMGARFLPCAGLVAALASCAGGNAPDVHTPPPEVSASAPLTSAEASRDVAPGDASAAQAPQAPPAIDVVLDDARLAKAREKERTKNYSEAAWAIEDARRGVSLPVRDACRWSYVLGRLRLAAGDTGEASAAFDRAADPACPLAPYATLRAAQALLRGGHAEDAASRAGAVSGEIAARDEVKLTVAEALAQKGDKAGAAAIWRAQVIASPSGPRWIETAARLATALLDGADGAPGAHADEALALATRVVVDAPRYAESSGAQAARARAVTTLRAAGKTVVDPLSDADRAHQAQAYLDAGDAKSAYAVADALLTTLAKAPPGDDLACRVAVTRAMAMGPQPQGTKADAFGGAATRCEGHDQQVLALYYGAKASAAASRYAEAVLRYAKVEQAFPKHRLADDARFQAALLVREMGDEGRALQMLTTLPDAYPEGDMRGEALFRVALARIGKGEKDAAKTVLDRASAIDPRDHYWASAGRADYFRARLAELSGDAEGAKKRYAEVVANEPLAYYMLQAYARLSGMDAAAARRALEDAVAKDADPSSLVYAREHPELRTPAFARAVALLEVGEIDAARRELVVAGAVGDKADPEVVWTVANALNAAGAPELGHSFARGKLVEGPLRDWLSHYPTGRWRFAWEAAFPRAYDAIVEAASAANGIPAPLTWAIMREESAFHADAKSHSNALGLMQLLASTAREVARGTPLAFDEQSLKRPDVSIPLGAKLLSSLRNRYPSNPSLAIAAYNGGAGSVRKWIDARGGSDFDVWVEQIPFDETRNYLKRVLASEAAYAFLYARPSLDDLLALPIRVTR